MRGHLSDAECAAAVLGESGEVTTNHLGECPACAEEARSFSALVAGARTQISKAGEQPEAFWRRQRAGISARLAARDFHRPWKRWIWVTATVTLIVLASTLLYRNNAPPVQTAAQTDPDDALLLSVQQSIRSDVPRALRPAALLAQEINRAQIARRNP